MNTILFDLDGTLLPMDIEQFTVSYFKELSTKMSPYLDSNTLPKLILESTKYMINNLDKDKTNMDAFFEDFKRKININIEELLPIFNDFYKNDFDKLKVLAKPSPVCQKVVNELKKKNYDLVIATNPLFPKEAIYHRIEWAGLEKNDFIFITTYENMHFCKPNIEYYMEILSHINRKAEDVMMVGNDVQEDMIASQLNIKTFLIDDYLIDRKSPTYNPDFKGSMKDFYEYVLTLPTL